MDKLLYDGRPKLQLNQLPPTRVHLSLTDDMFRDTGHDRDFVIEYGNRSKEFTLDEFLSLLGFKE